VSIWKEEMNPLIVFICLEGQNIRKKSSNIIYSNLLQVLDIEFHNIKALYRRAQAYMETADFFSAELDIKKALETDPLSR
jgi:hypothetical protein